ncbi:hypothetical protein MQX03_12985 [Chryseobacterium aahli]|uniref:hypothetical protein n=1 Tax=Chryseobacterium aahli TaxID=1278643 RepID=UPI001F6127A8|nr:hypothetical protein [Chryseobacterium aahli]MCI3938121.1 hypothetical protein [Chryseobacterium aahli]
MKNFAIISELINYDNNEKPIKFLKKSLEILGKEKLNILVEDLLFWQKIIYTSPTMANKGKITNKDFYLLKDYEMIEGYKKLFKNCLELNHFFLLEDDRILHNTDLSLEEVNKMRKLINEGYELTMKINIGNPKK